MRDLLRHVGAALLLVYLVEAVMVALQHSGPELQSESF